MEIKYGRPYIFELMERSEDDCEITLEWAANAASYYLDEIQEMKFGKGKTETT
jgi:hypothetical protein